MSRSREPERFNEHGQDTWPERPEERGYWAELVPGADEYPDLQQLRNIRVVPRESSDEEDGEA